MIPPGADSAASAPTPDHGESSLPRGPALPPPAANRVRVSAPAGTMLNLPRKLNPDAADTFYVRSLIRSQFRLAISVALGFLLLLIGLAIIGTTWPQIHQIRLATIPLPWWLLGVGVYPMILLSAFLFNRAAARNEDQYRSIVDQ